VLKIIKHSESITKGWHSTLQGPALSPKMRSPRPLFRARTPSRLPSSAVGRHWATQTCHNTRSTQTFLQPKRFTSKAWSTKAQQDWPVNVTINNRLLICKALRGRALCYAKPTLRMSPYFQVLALFRTFQRKVHPTLIIQELQTIKCIKKHNNSTIKLIKFVKLAMWWLPQTSDIHIRESRRFESMYTLQGKTRPTRHMLPTPSPHIAIDHTYLTWSMHSNLLQSHQQICTDPLPSRRIAPDTIHSSTTIWSTGPYPAFLPQQPMRRWGKDKLLLITNY
jgi:hypothetical protein